MQKRHSAEQIVALLRQADVALGKTILMAMVLRKSEAPDWVRLMPSLVL